METDRIFLPYIKLDVREGLPDGLYARVIHINNEWILRLIEIHSGQQTQPEDDFFSADTFTKIWDKCKKLRLKKVLIHTSNVNQAISQLPPGKWRQISLKPEKDDPPRWPEQIIGSI